MKDRLITWLTAMDERPSWQILLEGFWLSLYLLVSGLFVIGLLGCQERPSRERNVSSATAAEPAEPIPVLVPSEYGYGVTSSDIEPLAVACFSEEIQERDLLPGKTLRSIHGYVEYDGTSDHLSGYIRTRLWYMSAIVGEGDELGVVSGFVREGPQQGEWELVSAWSRQDGATRHLYRQDSP